MPRIKTILVVDDKESHLKEIAIILRNNNFKVFPLIEPKEDFPSNAEFIKILRTIYDKNIIDSKIEVQTTVLKELIVKNELDGFIIDYELEEGNINCSGVNFYNNFIGSNDKISNLPVLFLTGKKGSPLNNLQEFIRNINRGKPYEVAFFLSKDKFTSLQFKSELDRKIKDVFIDKPIMPQT